MLLDCAIKSIPKNKVESCPVAYQHMMNELIILEDTSHDHILKVYELLHNDDFFFIVTELAVDGDLHRFLTQEDSLSEPERGDT